MTRWFPRTIAGQLVFLLLAALILSQVVTVAMFFGERNQALREAWREEFFSRVASVAKVIEDTPANADSITSAVSSRWQVYRVRPAPSIEGAPASAGDVELAKRLGAYLNPQAAADVRLRSRYNGDGQRPAILRWVDQATGALFGWGADEGDDDAVMAIDVPLRDGRWLNVELPLRRPSSSWALLPLASAALMGIAILAVVVLMVRSITKPLRSLATAADRLGRGETLPELEVSGPDEIRRLTSAFNEMGARLTRFVEDRTRMLAAISHDLRTPITALRVRAELIDDEETRRTMIANLDDMKKMTEATLSFARDEATDEPSRTVDLAALIESVTDDMVDLGHAVSLEERGPLPYRCRPASMKRAFANLIDNAVRYGGAARVKVETPDDEIRVIVDDDGPGIPEDKLTHVFAPFVRLETSRSRETGGAGLGLAIARSVVLAHGGTIALQNRAERGLRALVRLPLRAPE
ncbi:ATP-binding protein [Rhodoligotrophos defluvii]|uniref:ATP-binding protein n=1 Tax=Rhodoligotrophos defluvii TaxID=2561934 RepID=UPI0010CA186A|nr:ATP-binding protein [Rhodoligotrophos defluvii]